MALTAEQIQDLGIEVLTLDSEHEYYESEFTLDGEPYRLLTRYNKRIDSWFASLYDGQGNPLALGRRITVGNFLFPWLVGRDRPAGQLLAIDTEDRDSDPGHDDLGNRVVIVYIDAESMEAAGANGG